MTERINLPRPPAPPAPPVSAPAERNGFNLKAIPGAVGAIAADVLGGVRDAPGAIALGAAQAVNEAVDIAEGVGQWVEDNLGTGGVEVSMQGIRMLSAEELQAKRKAGDDLSSVLNVPTAEWMQPDTVTGGLVEGVAQFLTGFGAASKVLKGTKIAAGLGQWGTSMAAGAMADAAVFDEHAQRLSNLIQSSPELANPVTEYLAADPTDSMAEGRFKNAIEGLGLGVMAHGLGMAVGAVRRFAQARGVDAADEVARRTANAKAQASEAGYKPPPPDQGPDLSPLGDAGAPLTRDAATPSAAERFRARMRVNPERDPLDIAIRKMGGIDTAKETDWAGRLGDRERVFGLPSLERPGKGLTLDALAEKLDELGWSMRDETGNIDQRRLADLLDRVESGESVYSDRVAPDILDELTGRGPGDTTAAPKPKRDYVLDDNGVLRPADAVSEADMARLDAEQRAAEDWWTAEGGDAPRPMEPVTPPPGDSGIEPPGPGPVATVRAVRKDKAAGWLEITGETEGKAININLARLDTPDDIKEAISKTAKIFGGNIDEARRGTISQAETAKLADDLGMTADSLLKRRQGAAFNAEEALAARRLLASSASNLVALAKQAKGGSEVDRVAFRRALSVHAGIQAQVSGMTAEAGRALAQFKIAATSADGQAKQLRELLELGGDTDLMADMVSSLDNPVAVNTFARQAQKATTKDMLLEAWINGLLSGPQTHAANTLSNSLTSLWLVGERYVASKVGQLTGTVDGVQAGEATAQLFGMIKGARDGFELAWKALKTGEPSDAMAKIENQRYSAITAENLNLSGVPGYFADFLGTFVRLPGRFLMAEDEFFKAIGYRMEANAQAYRQALREGLDGPELGRRMAELSKNPTEAIDLAAQDFSRYATFTNELGEAGRKFQQIVTKVPAFRLIFPFIRTPTNIMKFVGSRTPLAPVSKAIRDDIMAGGVRRDTALARIATGSMIMAIGADMAASGQITGAGPTDPGLKANLRRTGWQPYSLKVGDKYYSYNRLDPVGATLGLAADAAEIMGELDDAEASEVSAAIVMAISNNIVNKTYLQGFSTLVGAFNQMSPEAGAARGERVIEQFAGSLIPTGVATIERTLDPMLREGETLLDAMRERVPGYSKDLPPRRNLWGEPIILSGGLGPDIMSPIYESQEGGHPIDKEMVKHEVSVKMPGRVIDGIELTPKQYSEYVELAGNKLKDPSTGKGCRDTLNELITMPEYKRASDGPDGMKALMIKKVITAFREAARAQLQQDMPELRTKIQLNRQQAANLLRGTP